MRTFHLVLLSLLIALNSADAMLTIYGVEVLGVRELNPFYGSDKLLAKLLTSAVFSVVWVATYNYCDVHGFCRAKGFLTWLLTALVVFYLFVVVNNVVQLIFWRLNPSLTYRLDLYDSTGSFVGYAIRDGEEFLLYDRKGKLVARVSKKMTADEAIKLILSSLQYLA